MKENVAELVLGKQLQSIDLALDRAQVRKRDLIGELNAVEIEMNQLKTNREQVEEALNKLQEPICPVVTSKKKNKK